MKLYIILFFTILLSLSSLAQNVSFTVLSIQDSIPISYMKVNYSVNNELIAITNYNGFAQFNIDDSIQTKLRLSRKGIIDTLIDCNHFNDTIYINFGYYQLQPYEVYSFKRNVKKYWQSIHDCDLNKNNSIPDTTLYYSLINNIFFQGSKFEIKINGILKINIKNFDKSDEDIEISLHNIDIEYDKDLIKEWGFPKFPGFPLYGIYYHLNILNSNNVSRGLKEVSYSIENDSIKVFSATKNGKDFYNYYYQPDSSLSLIIVCDSNYRSMKPREEYLNRYTKYTSQTPRILNEHYFLFRRNFPKIKDKVNKDKNYCMEVKITLLETIPNCDKGIPWKNSYFSYNDLIKSYNNYKKVLDKSSQ